MRGGRPRLWDLITLGFSGGLVPCPAGFVVISLGLQYPERLLFALFLLVIFSLGLGSVLVSIGVFLILGKSLAAGRTKEGAFFQELSFLKRRFRRTTLSRLDQLGLRALRVLPALSSLFIAGLGAYFITSTYLTGKPVLASMLRALADWLDGTV